MLRRSCVLLAAAVAGCSSSASPPAVVPPGWAVRDVEPFVVASSGSALLDDGEKAVRSLRDALRKEGRFFANEPSRTTVWLYPRPSDFAEGTLARSLPSLHHRPFYTVVAPSKHADERAFFDGRTREVFTYASGREHGRDALVHEIIHAYVGADCPDAAPWVNEGLAVLFERMELDDHDNLRLEPAGASFAFLANALEDDSLPSFRSVARSSFSAFHEPRGEQLRYAFSAHVLYWLHERGLLLHFYHAYRAQAARERDGIALLASVLETDVDAIERQIRSAIAQSWERYMESRRHVRERPWH